MEENEKTVQLLEQLNGKMDKLIHLLEKQNRFSAEALLGSLSVRLPIEHSTETRVEIVPPGMSPVVCRKK